MFIELTDILRCPADHEEQYLVLIPDVIERRSVHSGFLGCPICRREYPITNGVADLRLEAGGESPVFPPVPSPNQSRVDTSAVAAFLGLAGSGGYVGLIGDVAGYAESLIGLLPGIHFVAVNASGSAIELPMLSLLRGDTVPVRSRSLRAVALGAGYGQSRAWQKEAERVVLPGLRIVGQGTPPEGSGAKQLASADGWWVAER